jgi:glutamate racemase
VLATPATFQGELFASLVDRFGADVEVRTQVCPLFVPLVEAGELDSARTRAIVREYVSPLVEAGVDELVLGCTHYPFLLPLIAEAAGPGVEIIDPAPAVARQTGRVLAQRGWLADGGEPRHAFYTTGSAERFGRALRELLRVEEPARRAAWVEGRLISQG